MSGERGPERHPGEGIWGAVLPLVFLGFWFLILRLTGGRGPSLLALVPATLYFGLVTLDLAAASWKAIDRRSGRSTGNYSSMVVVGVMLLGIWLVSGTTDFSGRGWPTSPGFIVTIGLVALVVEAVGVHRLGRIAKPPTGVANPHPSA